MRVEVLCWIDRVWSSKEYVCYVCDPNVHLDVPTIACFVYVGSLRAGVCSPDVVSLCYFAYYVVG